MVSLERPWWFNPKGARKALALNEVILFDPLEKYRTLAAGIYEWSGLPDNVPEGYIEETLFDHGAVSAKKVGGDILILPAHAVTRGVYGEILTWRPAYTNATGSVIEGLQETSDTPVLDVGTPIAEIVRVYAAILEDSLLSLRQNVRALRQPIAIYGNPGNAAETITLKNELDYGALAIPLIERTAMDIEAIDLKAKDYTQSLIATHNAMDNEILTHMAIKNTGVEKSSGITVEETTSLHQELRITSHVGLKLRLQWCEKINSVLDTNFEVRLADAYRTEMDQTVVESPEDKEIIQK
jgi:hypothetical protein